MNQSSKNNKFNIWLDTFIEEKGIDLEEGFEVTGTVVNYMSYENVILAIKGTSDKEQSAIKDMIVKIDFHNADVRGYFKHLAQAIAI